MTVTRLGDPQPLLTLGYGRTTNIPDGGTSGQIVTSNGSNGAVWGENVARITANGSNANTLLGPFVNFAAGSNVSLSTGSNTLTIHSATGIIDHGGLAGLLDDDHPQYATDVDLTAHTGDTTAAHAASAISVADAGSLFTATDAEAALQELAKKDIGYTAHGNLGSTETFDALTGWHSGTFNANCTFTFTGATSGLLASMVLELVSDGTSVPTWPGSVVWPGGSAPTLSTTPGDVDIIPFFSRDGGTTWYGFPTGSGGSALTIEDEGTPLATDATSLDFVGAGVTASGTGAAKTITIPGGAGSLDDLTDVTITAVASNDTLRYVSGEWVNDNRRWEPVTYDFGTGPELVWDSGELVMEWKGY